MEELVAEIGAAFLCADLGITPETRDDHARYIASWLKSSRTTSGPSHRRQPFAEGRRLSQQPTGRRREQTGAGLFMRLAFSFKPKHEQGTA